MSTHALLLLVLHASPARAASEVRVEVAFGQTRPEAPLQAEATWLGEPIVLPLRDDGRAPDDMAGDGVYTGAHAGEEVRTLSLTVHAVSPHGPGEELWAGTERLPAGRQVVTLSAQPGPQGPRLRRSAVALPGPRMEIAESTGVAALLGWTGVLLVYVFGLLVTTLRERRR